jgi:hypothetical protein
MQVGDSHLFRLLCVKKTCLPVVADVVSGVILREDLAALSFRWWDLSSYRALGRILSSWFRVRSSLMGLNAVAFALRARKYLLSMAHQFKKVINFDFGAF